MTIGQTARGTSTGAEMPIQVFVGSQDAQMLAVKILEFSIRQNTSADVKVFPLHEARIEFPTPKDAQNRPRTPFSFQRFYIPGLRGYQGRAIYLDSDMQVFRDIMEVWTLPFEGADLLAARELGESGRRPQFSVMLLNCSELKWSLPEIVADLDRGKLTYETLMYDMAVARKVRAAIEPTWNSLERFVEGETGLLHYTDMPTQPWVSLENPNGFLWVRALIQAVGAGFISRADVEHHIRHGFVRPSLLYQLDHRIERSEQLPRAARGLDDAFVPPYKQMEAGAAGGGLIGRMRGMLRRLANGGRPGHGVLAGRKPASLRPPGKE
jgi:glycosyl transferase family 8